MNIIEKIFGDFCNGDIINVQFVPFYKKQQQVERPFELRKFYLKCFFHFNRLGTKHKENFETVRPLHCSNRVNSPPVMKKIYHLSSCSTCARILKEWNPGKDVVLQDIKTEKISPSGLRGARPFMSSTCRRPCRCRA